MQNIVALQFDIIGICICIEIETIITFVRSEIFSRMVGTIFPSSSNRSDSFRSPYPAGESECAEEDDGTERMDGKGMTYTSAQGKGGAEIR